jgi:hypothetical protein
MKYVLLILFIGLTFSLEITFNDNETRTVAFSNNTVSEMFLSDFPFLIVQMILIFTMRVYFLI